MFRARTEFEVVVPYRNSDGELCSAKEYYQQFATFNDAANYAKWLTAQGTKCMVRPVGWQPIVQSQMTKAQQEAMLEAVEAL